MTDIRVIRESPAITAGVRETVPMAELSGFFARALRDTSAELGPQGIHPTGPPYGKYYSMPGSEVDVEVGFPVSAPFSPTGNVTPGELPGGSVVEAVHVGSYDTIGETYAEVHRYFEVNGLTPARAMWECYLTDPSSNADPSTWLTRICWPVG